VGVGVDAEVQSGRAAAPRATRRAQGRKNGVRRAAAAPRRRPVPPDRPPPIVDVGSVDSNPPMSTPTARPSTTPPPSRASRRTARPSLPRTCRTSTSWSPAPWASRPTAPESGRVRGTATSSGAYSANSAPSTERRKAPLAARDRVPRATGLRPVTVGRSPTTARPLSRPRSTSCRSSTGLESPIADPAELPAPDAHDVPLDLVVTPERTIRTETPYARPGDRLGRARRRQTGRDSGVGRARAGEKVKRVGAQPAAPVQSARGAGADRSVRWSAT